MKHIELLENFGNGGFTKTGKNRETQKIFDGTRRQIISVKLRNNEVLSKHQAKEPITVFCLAGNGRFLAGENLEEEQKLEAGTLLTLEAEIQHEVVAEPAIHILVTKFKTI